MQMKKSNKMTMKMKLKLRSKSKSKVNPCQAKTFRKNLEEKVEPFGFMEEEKPVDTVLQDQTIQEDTILPFFRWEDQKFLDELLLRNYLKYSGDLNGFELVDMPIEDSNSSEFPLETISLESPQKSWGEQTPSEMDSAETLVPVDFVDMWEKECCESIKEVQEIVVKSQRSFVKIGISLAEELAQSEPKVSCMEPKARCLELKKASIYSEPKTTKAVGDKKKKQSSLAWTVFKNRRNRKHYYANNYFSDKKIHFTSHKTEDYDCFDFNFIHSKQQTSTNFHWRDSSTSEYIY